jgi:hypothetical protein
MKTPSCILVAAMIVGGCEPRTEVVAGDVLVGRPSMGLQRLSGQFEIRDTKASRSVIDASKGGACLVAQLPDSPATCAIDSDCDVRPNSTTRWMGYCIPENPSDAASPKRCWVKPSNAYCAKDLSVGVHETPVVSGAEVYSYASATQGRPAEVRWRVTACLNGPLAGLPGCAGGEGTMMRDYGTARIPRPVPIPIKPSVPQIPPREPTPGTGPTG